MRPHLLLAVVLGGVLSTSCTLVDFRLQPDRHERNRALVTGFASAGWPANNDLLEVELLRPNRGSLVSLELWKLLRVDVGFVGLGIGLGPLDAGLGVLLHKPRPPRYVDWDDVDHVDDDCDDDCCWGCDDCDDDECEDDD